MEQHGECAGAGVNASAPTIPLPVRAYGVTTADMKIASLLVLSTLIVAGCNQSPSAPPTKPVAENPLQFAREMAGVNTAPGRFQIAANQEAFVFCDTITGDTWVLRNQPLRWVRIPNPFESVTNAP
jgi:hypothetical protein